MADYRSPLLDLPGAVEADAPDHGVAAHYGEPMQEQRRLAAGSGFVDLSHRGVVRISGPDRLGWLHALTSQALEGLAPGVAVSTLVLSPNGHVEHALYGVDDGTAFWAHVEPGAAAALVSFLDGMRFLSRVEVADVTGEWAIVWLPPGPAVDSAAGTPAAGPGEATSGEAGDSEGTASGAHPLTGEAGNPEGTAFGAHPLTGEATNGRPIRRTDRGVDVFVPRASLASYTSSLSSQVGPPAGVWAHEALRIEAYEPRLGVDTDHRTIPNEVGWLGSAVHLDKGCYRGQETVARVHNLGRPPRRLVFLHLDGSVDRLPSIGDPVEAGGRQVGFVGSVARHWELGPIGLALIKRNVPVDSPLVAGGVAASQEVIVDPEAGLHFRASLG